jgi:hypothetical protein
LEAVCSRKVTVGSNPTLSATFTPTMRSKPTLLAAFATLAAAAALTGGSHPADAARGVLFEKTVDAPKATRVAVDLPYEKVTIIDVESENAPSDADVKDAEKRDPRDTTLVMIRFRYRNEDFIKRKVNLRVVLLDDTNGVIADGGRSGTLGPKKTDDTFSFVVPVRTVEWPSAKRMKIEAIFYK